MMSLQTKNSFDIYILAALSNEGIHGETNKSNSKTNKSNSKTNKSKSNSRGELHDFWNQGAPVKQFSQIAK